MTHAAGATALPVASASFCRFRCRVPLQPPAWERVVRCRPQTVEAVVHQRVARIRADALMTSNKAEPTSSYRYFDGSSFCPRISRPARTSAAKSLLLLFVGAIGY